MSTLSGQSPNTTSFYVHTWKSLTDSLSIVAFGVTESGFTVCAVWYKPDLVKVKFHFSITLVTPKEPKRYPTAAEIKDVDFSAAMNDFGARGISRRDREARKYTPDLNFEVVERFPLFGAQSEVPFLEVEFKDTWAWKNFTGNSEFLISTSGKPILSGTPQESHFAISCEHEGVGLDARFLARHNLPRCGWIDVECERIFSPSDLHDMRVSHGKRLHEFWCSSVPRQHKGHLSGQEPRLLTVAWDVEQYSHNHLAFPDADHINDEVYMISVVTQRVGDARRSFLITRFACELPENCATFHICKDKREAEIQCANAVNSLPDFSPVTIVNLACETEHGVLMAFQHLVCELDPDVMMTFNGWGYDQRTVDRRLLGLRNGWTTPAVLDEIISTLNHNCHVGLPSRQKIEKAGAEGMLSGVWLPGVSRLCGVKPTPPEYIRGMLIAQKDASNSQKSTVSPTTHKKRSHVSSVDAANAENPSKRKRVDNESSKQQPKHANKEEFLPASGGLEDEFEEEPKDFDGGCDDEQEEEEGQDDEDDGFGGENIAGNSHKSPTQRPRSRKSAWGQTLRVVMHGRCDFDILPHCDATVKLQSKRLELFAQEFLGRGKHDMDHAEGFANFKALCDAKSGTLPLLSEEENQRIASTYAKMGLYCVEDARLVLDLANAIAVWPAAVAYSNVYHVNPEDVHARRQTFKSQHLIFESLHNSVAPFTRRAWKTNCEELGFVATQPPRLHLPPPVGATVLDNKPQMTMAAVFDFASLYPSVMVRDNLCPTTFVLANGGRFSHPAGIGHSASLRVVRCEQQNHGELSFGFLTDRPGLYPTIVTALNASRKATRKLLAEKAEELKTLEKTAEKTPDLQDAIGLLSVAVAALDARQKALKFTANSFYGVNSVLNGPLTCQPVGHAITCQGRAQLQKLCAAARKGFPFVDGGVARHIKLRVIYGDTDSIFAEIPDVVEDTAAFVRAGEAFADFINVELAKTPPMKLEFEKAGRLLFVRKKRYAIQVLDEAGNFLPAGHKKQLIVKGLAENQVSLPQWTRAAAARLLRAILSPKPSSFIEVAELVADECLRLLEGEIALESLVRVAPFNPPYISETALPVQLAREMAALGQPVEPGTRIEYGVCRVLNASRVSEKARPLALVDKDTALFQATNSAHNSKDKLHRLDHLYYLEAFGRIAQPLLSAAFSSECNSSLAVRHDLVRSSLIERFCAAHNKPPVADLCIPDADKFVAVDAWWPRRIVASGANTNAVLAPSLETIAETAVSFSVRNFCSEAQRCEAVDSLVLWLATQTEMCRKTAKLFACDDFDVVGRVLRSAAAGNWLRGPLEEVCLPSGGVFRVSDRARKLHFAGVAAAMRNGNKLASSSEPTRASKQLTKAAFLKTADGKTQSKLNFHSVAESQAQEPAKPASLTITTFTTTTTTTTPCNQKQQQRHSNSQQTSMFAFFQPPSTLPRSSAQEPKNPMTKKTS